VKKPLSGKVQKGDFPAALGNPAKRQDFYFFHRPTTADLLFRFFHSKKK